MSLTRVELTSTVSSSIRGKLSWPTIVWFGARAEHFVLLNGIKSKLLNIQDGSIHQHIPLVGRLLSESVVATTSRDGKLLVGLKKSGDIFAYEISRDVVYSITGLSDFKQKGGSIELYASTDLDKLLVVQNCNTFYVWSKLQKKCKLKYPPKQTLLTGRWYALDVSSHIPLPVDGTEAKVDSFGLDQGMFSSVVFIDSEGVLQISTLLVTTEPSMYAQRMSPYVEWFSQPIAGSPAIPIVSSADLLLVRYAPTLPVCAVVINQLSVRDRCLIFVSPQHRYQVAANLRCLRESAVSGRRPLWIADIGWTFNSLLLVVLTQCGCVAILSRLGNPLYISTREMSVSGAFDHLISLLPRNINRSRKGNRMNRSLSLSAVTHQSTASMSSHPSVMKFLISDGCQVLIFQIPEDITTRSLAMALLSDARMLSHNTVESCDLHLSDTHLDEPIDQLSTKNSLRALMQVWCLLVSAHSWSKELKDVSNEVVVTMSGVVSSMIRAEDLEGSAARLTHTTVRLITMVAIDSQRQHVLPASIKLISTIVGALLAYTDCSKISRLKLLQIAYVLLKVCENALNRFYSILPMLDSHVMGYKCDVKSTYEVLGDTYLTTEQIATTNQAPTSLPSLSSLNVLSTSSVSSCLAPLYRKIHRHIIDLYKSGLPANVDTSDLSRLLHVVQNVLRQRYGHVVGDLNTTWLHTDILSLEGFHSSAINEWLDKSSGTGKAGRTTNALHSILYIKLHNAKLQDLLHFVDECILRDLSVHSHTTDKDYLNVRSLQAGSPVKKLVQSLARFMARYFTNNDIYVFPSHNPLPLPPLYSPHSHDVPVLGVDRTSLCQAASRLPTDELWSVSATVRYLLISGLLAELVWFCKAVGDLKSSLCVSLIISDHLLSLKHIKRQQVNSVLPEELRPEAIHKLMFADFLRGNEVTCGDARLGAYQMILPTALFGFPCLSTQLSMIWRRIKSTASKLSPFVPNELYLPSPALYCPQVTIDSQSSDELNQEVQLRETLSADIQTLINLLVATHTDLPCCGWIVRGLVDAWKVKTKKKKNKIHLTKALELFLPYHIAEKNKQNQLTFAIFRNTCCILWMLHVRDELSLMLRKSTQLLHNLVTVSDKVDDTDSVNARYVHLENTLTWCLRYLPFSQYLQSANAVCEVIISVCEELPATAKLARKLSQGITDIDSLAPEVKDKMDHLLQTWQTVDLDPHQSRSLSMYYFECCNKHERNSDTDVEKHIFSSVKAHKTIGSRVYEYDLKYVEFMELYFVVSYHPSLPQGGTAKPPALVPTNRKTLEQNAFSRCTLVFHDGSKTLESTINDYSNSLKETSLRELSVSEPADQTRSDSPNKSGMFARKRWSVSEQHTYKQMKKIGVAVNHRLTDSGLDKSTRGADTTSPPYPTASAQLLTQSVHLSERYRKLAVKFQWLTSWCETQLATSSSLQPSTKVSIDLQWMVLALIMVERWRQSHSRTSEYNMLPPPATHVSRPTEQAPVSEPVSAVTSTLSKPAATSDDFSSSALANAISLHTSTELEQQQTDDEEILEREQLLEEMRKHSRLATATQPINMAYTKSPESTGFSQADASRSLRDEDADIDVRESADSFLLDDSATTVWSSATLPNLSASSLTTGIVPADTIDTEPQSTTKTQQSISTIGSRKSRSRRRRSERFAAPVAQSTLHDEQFDSMSEHSSPADRFNCQIPLLRVSKNHQNRAYYSSPERHQKFPHQKKKLELLSVRDINSSDGRSLPAEKPESVRLPLLSMHVATSADKAAATETPNTAADQFQLANIRQSDTRWSQPIPLLQAQAQPTHGVPPKQSLPAANTSHLQSSVKSTALAHGPALLQQYDESNRQKEELISRMIKIMRSKAKPVIQDGKPTHPKYQLLKLDKSKATASSTAPRRVHHRKQEQTTTTTIRPHKSKRSKKPKGHQKEAVGDSVTVEDLTTVSERTESEVQRVDAGTDCTSPVETVDRAIQHSVAHIDDRYADYSYLFSLATAQDGVTELKEEELDAAANDNNFAAVQYKAIKLQEEAHSRPQMVDAAVMAVEPSRTKTVIIRSEEDREGPVVGPNIIHDLQFRAPVTSAQSHDYKENVPETRREYIGIADITPIEVPPVPVERKVAAPVQHRSQQILLEITANQQTDREDGADKVEVPTHLDKPPLVPPYESAELDVPRIVTPRAKFESADGKDEGKLTIARNLSNMDDRLEYIMELRAEMMQQIDETEMVPPRYHLTYQQRQTQTKLSMPTEGEYATILQSPAQTQVSQSTQVADSLRQPKQFRQQQKSARTPRSIGTEDVRTPATTERAVSSLRGDTVTASSVGGLSNRQHPGNLSLSPTPRSARSDVTLSVVEDGSEMLKLAEELVGDDESLTGEVNSTMLAELLATDLSHLSQKLGNSPKSKSSAHRKEDLKRWRKEHQAKVREKYKQEVEVKRRVEARPFQSQKHLTAKQIKRVKEERQVKRERMIATNQSKRIESAENLLEDILVDGAELLAMERMMDLTTPITTKKSVKPTRQQSAVSQKRAASLQRGKSIIRIPQNQHLGYTPSGFHTVAHPSSSSVLGHTLLDASSYDVDELPLYDESQLLVPIFGGEREDRERIHQLLYSDEAMSKFGSQMSLSNISDLAARSEVSGESYLDWDVVDDMVAMLSNRGSSAPSTPAGHS